MRLCDELATGQDVTVDMEQDVLINHTTGKEYSLKPIGEVGGGSEEGWAAGHEVGWAWGAWGAEAAPFAAGLVSKAADHDLRKSPAS